MSQLEKLQILGIRSFSPKEFQTIIFRSPVTLIVGENGSGKTTLIECLRYATTGEIPAFTVGGAGRNANFAHDLNVSDIDSCRSQVALNFHDVNGQGIHAGRSMQVTRKTVGGQKKIDCKAIDSTVKKPDPRLKNEMVSMTTKCNDMNREMSNLLGVTPAVLINVIFCHQEDSNWPLSEPKALKCRFDDIFNATKYMKALDSNKNTQKDLAKTISECKKELPHLERFKEHSKTCQDQIAQIEETLRNYVSDMAKLKSEIEPIEAELKEVGRRNAEIDKLKSTLASQKSQKAATEKYISELRLNIHDFYTGNTDELKRDIGRFESDQTRIAKELDERKRELEQLERKESALDKQKGELMHKKGKLEGELQANQIAIEKRDSQIVEFAKQFGLSGFSRTPMSEAKVTEFQKELQKKLRQVIDEIEKEKADFDRRYQKAKSESERASNAVAANREAISMKESTVARIEKDIKEAQEFLSDMDNRQSRLGKLEKEIKDGERALNSAVGQLDEDSTKTEISKLKAEHAAADTKLRSLQEELKIANREKSVFVALELLQKERATKDDTLQKLLDKHIDARTELFPGVHTDKLRNAVEDALVDRSKQLQTSTRKLNDAKMSQRSKEKERDLKSDELKKKEQELRDAEEKVFKVAGGDEIEDELERIRESLEKLQFEKGTADGSESVFKSYVKKLEGRPCCPLCERNFDDKQRAENLTVKLKREIKTLPDRASKLRQKIDAQQKKQTDLLQLQPIVVTLKNLKSKDIPSLKKQVDGLNSEIRTLKKEINELDGQVTIETNEEQMVKAIQSDVGQIDSLWQEIKEIDRRISDHKEKLGSARKIRSIEAIETEFENAQVKLDKMTTSLASKQKALDTHRDKVQRLRERINELTKEKLEITDAMQQRIAYQDKFNSLTEQRGQQRKDLDATRETSKSLATTLSELRAKERQLDGERDDLDRECRKRQHDMEGASPLITKMTESIQNFVTSGKQAQFDECARKVERIEADLDDLQRRCDAMKNENEEQDRSLGQSKIKLRDLLDSMAVMEKEQLVRELTVKIDAIIDQIGGIDMVEGDYSSHVSKVNSLKNRLHKIMGQKETSEKALAEKRELLTSSGYKDADANYSSMLLKEVVTEAAYSDIGKWYKALDKAVIKYHGSKMEEINDKLHDLWQKIYKHDDIDYIAIRSETADASDKRRAYNYRVVMGCKNSTELDMRGRCSAGQKVLASILIRIALAEVFSASCGVLALDEPTTNLDQANIDGLAEALGEIVREKSQQKNFQLIVITHDEGFVRQLLQHGMMERIETHYRISKNREGYSTIEECQNNDLLGEH